MTGNVGRERRGSEKKTALLLDFNQHLLFADGHTLHLCSHPRSTGSVQLQLSFGLLYTLSCRRDRFDAEPLNAHFQLPRLILFIPDCCHSLILCHRSLQRPHSATLSTDTLPQNPRIRHNCITKAQNTFSFNSGFH